MLRICRFIRQDRCCQARKIFSAVIGISLIRMPVASATALAMAGATKLMPASPTALAPKGPGPSLA